MTFLVIAIIAALLGFTSIAGASITIAKIFFFIFLALFIISIIAGGVLFKGAKNLTLKQ